MFYLDNCHRDTIIGMFLCLSIFKKGRIRCLKTENGKDPDVFLGGTGNLEHAVFKNDLQPTP